MLTTISLPRNGNPQSFVAKVGYGTFEVRETCLNYDGTTTHDAQTITMTPDPITVTPSTFVCGTTVRITSSGFQPGEVVEAWFDRPGNDSPRLFPQTGTAAADGTVHFTVTVSCPVSPGEYLLTIGGVTSDVRRLTTFTVVTQLPSPAPTPSATASSSTAPSTTPRPGNGLPDPGA